jgi:hypothetical protein
MTTSRISTIGGAMRPTQLVLILSILCWQNTSCKTKSILSDCGGVPTGIVTPSVQYADVNISGVVVINKGELLPNAKIIFDNATLGTTDGTGKFAIKATKRIDKVYTITAQLEGYNNASASYHTQMSVQQYKLILTTPCACKEDLIFDQCLTHNLSLEYQDSNISLSASQKIQIDKLIECLKRNPDKQVILKYQLADANKNAAAGRIYQVSKYLIEKGGISETRIQKQVVTFAGNGSNLAIQLVQE